MRTAGSRFWCVLCNSVNRTCSTSTLFVCLFNQRMPPARVDKWPAGVNHRDADVFLADGVVTVTTTVEMAGTKSSVVSYFVCLLPIFRISEADLLCSPKKRWRIASRGCDAGCRTHSLHISSSSMPRVWQTQHSHFVICSYPAGFQTIDAILLSITLTSKRCDIG